MLCPVLQVSCGKGLICRLNPTKARRTSGAMSDSKVFLGRLWAGAGIHSQGAKYEGNRSQIKYYAYHGFRDLCGYLDHLGALHTAAEAS